jgi:hypothetical protein
MNRLTLFMPWATAAGLLLFALVVTGLPRVRNARQAPPASDAAQQAARYGIDYQVLLSAAKRNDADARRFLALSALDIFDGAGSEDYAGDLWAFAGQRGDRAFSELVRSLSPRAQKQVLEYIAYEQYSWADFTRDYPKLAALMRERGVEENPH